MQTQITPLQAHDMLQNNDAVLIDVREADEFKGEHIPCAWSIPLSAIRQNPSVLDNIKGKNIIFQCLKGGRGNQACAVFFDHADKTHKLYNIDGGITAWRDAGLPVIGGSQPSKISIFRQVQIIIGFGVALLTVLGFAAGPAYFVAAGLLATALGVAGVTGWCGLAIMLQKMPWNK